VRLGGEGTSAWIGLPFFRPPRHHPAATTATVTTRFAGNLAAAAALYAALYALSTKTPLRAQCAWPDDPYDLVLTSPPSCCPSSSP
jgi:hypothetical protein